MKGFMAVLIILFMIVFLLLGYCLMDKVDQAPIHEIGNDNKLFVLIFGCSFIADMLMQILDKYSIGYRQIEDEYQLDRTEYYSHIFAISENDFNNLMISIIANRRMEACNKIAICNGIHNQKIFKENNIRYLYGESIHAETLFDLMFPNYKMPKESGKDEEDKNKLNT